MEVPETSLTTLKEEGIDKPEDIFEFLKDDLNSVFESLQKPLDKVVENKVIDVAPLVVSEKSKKRIVVTMGATQYYAQVGRDIIPSNMHWKTLTNFNIQWNALKDLKKQDNPDVPKITKNGSIIKWIESF